MVHQPIDTSYEKKEELRINLLEQRVIVFENTLLRKTNATLEKRVIKLEKECSELKELLVEKANHEKKNCEKKKDSSSNELDNYDFKSSEVSDYSESSDDDDESKKFEFESVYDRMLKLVEDMKSDCVNAINQKIPSASSLPKLPMKPTSSVNNSRPGTPARSRASSISATSVPARSRASSVSAISVPSRSNTPSGIKTPSNVSTSIPITSTAKIPNSHILSRPNTPSSSPSSTLSTTLSTALSPPNVIPISSKMPPRSRTPIWTTCNKSSRPSTPNTSNTTNTLSVPNSPPNTQSPLCNSFTLNISDVNSSIHSNIQSNIQSDLTSKSTGIPMYTPMIRKQAIV